MEKKKTGISQTGARMPVVLLKSLLVSYLMAGALLLLLALLLYRMQLSAQAVSIGILVIYAVTAGLSGWLAGKGMQDPLIYPRLWVSLSPYKDNRMGEKCPRIWGKNYQGGRK